MIFWTSPYCQHQEHFQQSELLCSTKPYYHHQEHHQHRELLGSTNPYCHHHQEHHQSFGTKVQQFLELESELDNEFECPIFTSDCTKNKVKHQCGHTFCTNCVTKSQEPNFRCMICRSPIF
ncbi:unnamed protein product [Oikopleura dioica]|uniref:RING-type domain-containing protein n=1 Tax=Oikopleura dioica TaxID=34765 RepID=E4XFU8_OIKDI|nr:unnamed protein product [Oikopleura dioica]